MELIIRIRLEALKSNLNKIRRILESVNDRRLEIDELSQDLRLAEDKLRLVGRNVTDVLDTSQNTFAEKPIDESLTNLLEKARGEALNLRELLQKIEKDVSKIRKRWTPFPFDKSLEAAFKATLEEDLDKRIGAFSRKIDADIKALSVVSPSAYQIEKAWLDYSEMMSEQSQLIFSDYVEFLGGLALRYAGLDEGICRKADELMRSRGSFGRTHWSSLTIPASQEAMTLARSIRMRFPEWTIWAVPLTAHEFAHVVISGNSRLTDYIETQYPARNKKEMKRAEKGRQDMLVFLADAFATYVMGPAYACAVILLRFNPLGAYQDKSKGPADAKRACIVLSMLEHMGTMLKNVGRDPNLTPPYLSTLDKLRTEWGAAISQTKTDAPVTWNQDVGRLNAWSNHFFQELCQSYPDGLYEGKLWKSTLAALEDLLRGSKDLGDKLKGNEEWRDVLNAAWAFRVNKPDDSQNIAKNAEELWKRIRDKKDDIKDRRGPRPGLPGGGTPGVPGGGHTPDIRDKKYA